MRLTVLNPPSMPAVVEGRPYTLATIAFLLTMLLAVAIAYAWDNLMPAGARRDAPAPVGVTLVTSRNGFAPADADGDVAIALVDQRER